LLGWEDASEFVLGENDTEVSSYPSRLITTGAAVESDIPTDGSDHFGQHID
jgi:hypothetical protein